MNKTDLLGLRIFHAIVEHGTLRAASHSLGVNPSAISQQLKSFESSLGTALFIRNTRTVSLTDAGRILHERTGHLISEAQTALEATRADSGQVSGELRITLPYRAWQRVIAPRLAAFRFAHPDITLDLSVDEELVDVSRTRHHAGIRIGDHVSGDVLTMALTREMSAAYVASPEYLEQAGVPLQPEDLLAHSCLRYRQIGTGKIMPWKFLVDGQTSSVDVAGPLVFDDLRTIVEAACQGHGVCWTLKSGVSELLASGKLVQVLSNVTPSRPGFFLYFPRELKGLPRLRAFINHFSRS